MQTKTIPTTKRSGACPICGDTSGDCRLTDGEIVMCLSHHEEIDHPDYQYVKDNGGAQAAGVWGIFAPRYFCPVCNSGHNDCRAGDGGLLFCSDLHQQIQTSVYRYIKESRDGKGLFVLKDGSEHPNGFNPAEYARKKLELQQKRQQLLQQQAHEYRQGLTRQERDANIRMLHKYLGLKDFHRQQLKERGLNDQQIDAGLFFSVAPDQEVPPSISPKLAGIEDTGDRRVLGYLKSGIACVAFDHQNYAIGFQVRDENPDANNKYLWAKSTFSSHLQTGELPMAKMGKQTYWIVLCEGILKPFVAFCRLGVPCIGASNGGFLGSPLQLRACLGTSRTMVIALDGGDVINPHVLSRWESFLDEYQYPYQFYFAWWGQWQKSDPDIDEISEWNPQYLLPEDMGKAIARNAITNFWIILLLLHLCPAKNIMEVLKCHIP